MLGHAPWKGAEGVQASLGLTRELWERSCHLDPQSPPFLPIHVIPAQGTSSQFPGKTGALCPRRFPSSPELSISRDRPCTHEGEVMPPANTHLQPVLTCPFAPALHANGG